MSRASSIRWALALVVAGGGAMYDAHLAAAARPQSQSQAQSQAAPLAPHRTVRLATAINLGSNLGISPGSSPSGAMRGGRSLGSPTEGHLVGGVRLEESPWLRIVPCHRDEDVRWGIDPLVSMLDRAARAVRKQFPDSVLSVGHLSRREGGEIDAHASHESGRDADVGFYIVNQQGKAIYAEHFVAFAGDGTAPSWPGAKFDDARNWAFVSSIVTDPRARVSYVFVASPLRARLLSYAQRIGAPYATRVRASEVMAQPRGSLPHDDHFHVRISCPSGMEGCIEYPTRNVARLRSLGRPHARPRAHVLGTSLAPAPVLPAPPTPSASSSPHEGATRPRKPPVGNEDLPAVPAASAAPLPPDTPASTGTVAPPPPPASLEAPIDDVDGIEE